MLSQSKAFTMMGVNALLIPISAIFRQTNPLERLEQLRVAYTFPPLCWLTFELGDQCGDLEDVDVCSRQI